MSFIGNVVTGACSVLFAIVALVLVLALFGTTPAQRTACDNGQNNVVQTTTCLTHYALKK